MLDVGEDELLVLLFVVEAQLDQFELQIRTRSKVSFHLVVYPTPISMHFVETRPGHQATRAAVGVGTESFVVRIKQVLIARIKWSVSREVFGQNEGFKKPRRMRQMPF